MRHFLNMSKKSIVTTGSLMILIFSVTFLSFTDRDFKLTKNLDIFFSLIREVNLFYVDEKDPEEIIRKGIEGVLSGLDPYTTYIPESEKETFETMTTGRYGGIGALVQKEGDYFLITELYQNFPAHKAGLKVGDVITKIDGKSLKDIDPAEVSEMLKGTPGSSVKLTLKRQDQDSQLSLTVRRDQIKLNSVTYYGITGNNTGYIRLSRFTEDAHKDFEDALKKLKNDQSASSIIVDLRGNPGGLMKEAVLITNLFVEQGSTIVSTKGKLEQWNSEYKAEHKPVDTEIPLVVLVNGRSASASEIIAGAIQDLDRGIIMGERTFGKGLVQTTRPLSYNAQIKITTARYYTPSGRCIQAHDFRRKGNNGTPVNIPDSLISEFSTLNGRVVTDGGGIKPDIEIEQEMLSHLASTMYTQNLIFDFATIYSLKNNSIAGPLEFSLTDSDYQDFIDFLDKREFEYKSQSEIKLERLKEIAKNENYYSLSSKEFEALEEKLKSEINKDLITFRDQIQKLIEDEIIGRYYFKQGQVGSSLKHDQVVYKAAEILEDDAFYHSVLTP